MSFSKTLKELLKAHTISQSRLANAIGFSQRAVSKWINEQAEPTETAIVACAKFFGISADEMLRLQDEDILFAVSDFSFLSESEKELLRLFRKMNLKKQTDLVEYAQTVEKPQA